MNADNQTNSDGKTSADEMTMREALIRLHGGADRQGPGDDAFSLELLRKLPGLPPDCAIADLGCGAGEASLLLAQYFQHPVLCVDMAEEFLAMLSEKAKKRGIDRFITTLCADMGALDPAQYQFDLLWSEGAAYNLTFAGAMRQWRPLMTENGVAVVSEMNWFGAERPREALDFWGEAYPAMADEHTNIASAKEHGFDLLFTQRLPSSAWWTNYYNPLLELMDVHAQTSSKTLQAVIAEMRQEIELFRKHSDDYGYTFYVLKAA